MKTNYYLLINCIILAIGIKVLHAGQAPNILWIITDDQRFDSIQTFNRIQYGKPENSLGTVLSPNVDRLASMGTTFINTYNQNPACAPSRAVMHTGRYSHSTGIYGFENYKPQGMPHWKPMVPDILKNKAGYQTVSVGKLGLYYDDQNKSDGYELNLGYRKEFTSAGLVEWEANVKRSGGKKIGTTDIFNLPDGSKLEWDRAANKSTPDIQILKEKFQILRQYGGDDKDSNDDGGDIGNGSIIGGMSTSLAEKMRDTNYASVLINHLNNAGKSYKDFLGRSQVGPELNKPVFAHCGFEFPHTPVLPPYEFRKKFSDLKYNIPLFSKEEQSKFPPQLLRAFEHGASNHFTDAEKQQMIADYFAFCAYGDSLVGQLADRFISFSEKHGRPWVILYVCGDNGWKLNEHGMISKFLHYEHDLKNPMIAISSDKKNFPAGKVVHDFTMFVDMLPTFLSSAGIDISKPEYSYLNGRDLAKTAAGTLRPRDYIIAEPSWVTGPRAVIRTQDYKFSMKIRPFKGNSVKKETAGKDIDWAIKADLKEIEPMLYDLRADKNEINSVAFDPYYRPVLDALRSKLQDIVLGDNRVEIAWDKRGGAEATAISNFAPGADDGKIVVPKLAQKK